MDPPSYVHPPDSGGGVPTLEELGWSKSAGPNGKTYYLNHVDKSSHWELPPEVLAKLTGNNRDPRQSTHCNAGFSSMAGPDPDDPDPAGIVTAQPTPACSGGALAIVRAWYGGPRNHKGRIDHLSAYSGKTVPWLWSEGERQGKFVTEVVRRSLRDGALDFNPARQRCNDLFGFGHTWGCCKVLVVEYRYGDGPLCIWMSQSTGYEPYSLQLGATAGTPAAPASAAQPHVPSDSGKQGLRVHIAAPGLQTQVVKAYLQHDRLYGQPGTDGSVCSNLWHYGKTHHPLTALFCTDQRKTSRAQLLYIFWVSQTILYFTWAHPALVGIFAEINCKAGCKTFEWPPPSNLTAIHDSDLYNARAWTNGTAMCTPIDGRYDDRYEKPICEQLEVASLGRSDDKLMLKIEALDIAQVYLGDPKSLNIEGEGMYVFKADFDRMCEGYDYGTVFSSLWFRWTISIYIINWAVNLVLTWAFQSSTCNQEACSCKQGAFLGITGVFWGFCVALANLVAIFDDVFRDEFVANYIVMLIIIFVVLWPIELPLRFGLSYGADRKWFKQNFGEEVKNIEEVVADAQLVDIAKTAVSEHPPGMCRGIMRPLLPSEWA